MSVLTTIVAYATARPIAANAFATIAGTTLAAAGALSLNQWWERAADARMQRTRARPLPSGSLPASDALAWSVFFSMTGITMLVTGVNIPAALCAFATILVYGIVYTPLKRRTRWATEIGAVSGALPALLGNAAAGDLAARPGLVLAGILLLWQMPHFFAIGWRHRADYRAAGFTLLPAIDHDGRRTAAWSLGYAIALTVFSLVPWCAGWLGAIYGVVALAANVWLLMRAWQFWETSTQRNESARRLFLASIYHLPIVLAALLLESW
jgi:protoheme IX farnesyltransferase